MYTSIISIKGQYAVVRPNNRPVTILIPAGYSYTAGQSIKVRKNHLGQWVFAEV